MIPTYKEFLDDANLRDALYASAHRERAEAIQRLVFAPLKALFARPAPRRTRMLRRSAYC